MAEETSDKTEEPTPHKLQEARKKGQVAHSREVTTAIALIAAYKLFAAQAEGIWYKIVDLGAIMFRQIEVAGRGKMDIGMFSNLVGISIKTILDIMVPLTVPLFFLIILVSMIQTQFMFSAEPMKPDLNKINPFNALKRIFSLKGMVQILINLAKIFLVAWITWTVISKNLTAITSVMTMEPFNIMLFVGGLVMEIATKVGLFYLGIALLDYLYQRYDFHKQMMMTKQEVKEEYKRLEGDPLIKQAQRQRQREMAQRRQKGAVPGADVVVTNPVHLACAIRYNPEFDKAPLLLAKGMRLFAQEIKEIAEEHYIPIVENEKLARSIYDSTEVGEEIPPHLYRAVAEVLAFVYKLGRNKRKRKDRPAVNRK